MATYTDKTCKIKKALPERLLFLDGAMGTMLAGNNLPSDMPADLWVIEKPEAVREVHRLYLEAGADIIKTDSFNSNPLSLAAFGCANLSYLISKEAARIASEEARRFSGSDKTRFVAGSVGPPLLPSPIDIKSLINNYLPQIRGLAEGGADIILVETVTDTVLAKAALLALAHVEKETGIKLPAIVSATIDTNSSRLPSGETLKEFHEATIPFAPIAIGLNCCNGSKDISNAARYLADMAEEPVILCPSAGLPDADGTYPESPDLFAANLKGIIREGKVRMAGGCCGTTPEHIRVLINLHGGQE